MELKTKFFGTPTTVDDLQPGDLFLADGFDRRLLVFHGMNGNKKHFCVLRGWKKSDSDEYPYGIVEGVLSNYVLRKITGELELRIGSSHEDAVSVPKMAQPTSVLNGQIFVLPSGAQLLRADDDYTAYFWDISTGANTDVTTVRRAIVIDQWQLVWRDDEDEVVLCEHKQPSALAHVI